MRSDLVVIADEAIELDLELLLCLDRVLLVDELLERLVEALDLSAGLGMIGTRVLRMDAQAGELHLEGTGEPVPGVRTKDQAVVGEE
jgi:hypothetical protein